MSANSDFTFSKNPLHTHIRKASKICKAIAWCQFTCTQCMEQERQKLTDLTTVLHCRSGLSKHCFVSEKIHFSNFRWRSVRLQIICVAARSISCSLLSTACWKLNTGSYTPKKQIQQDYRKIYLLTLVFETYATENCSSVVLDFRQYPSQQLHFEDLCIRRLKEIQQLDSKPFTSSHNNDAICNIRFIVRPLR